AVSRAPAVSQSQAPGSAQGAALPKPTA
ncbi:DUF1049 domain-containing protein, partial [Mesorhizobium sp. M7A.F.Ca.CA.001.05.1.1]